MKALKSDRARKIVSVNWGTMTATSCDGTKYSLNVVSGTPTSDCTCPSGDGSLRWPCPVHPSEAGEDA